jgi:hypothetical protein
METKLLKILGMISFIVVAISSVPLVIKYFLSERAFPLLIGIHVWFGVAFIFFKIIILFMEFRK